MSNNKFYNYFHFKENRLTQIFIFCCIFFISDMSGQLNNFGLGLVNPASYTINHPIVYREVVHTCTLTFDQQNYRIIPTVSATSTYVLAEYIHLGSPRIICHLQPGQPLTMNTMPTYHFMVSNGQLLGPFVQN